MAIRSERSELVRNVVGERRLTWREFLIARGADGDAVADRALRALRYRKDGPMEKETFASAVADGDVVSAPNATRNRTVPSGVEADQMKEPEFTGAPPTTPVTTEQEMRGYVLSALELQGRGVALPFAILDRASGDVIGSTRYANIESAHRRLEIGWTWIARAHQRTAVNTEAKVLLLEHAFETLRVQRVELKTDACNARSREAILRLGAAQEGVLRRHMITRSGRVRDTVYFSIIDTEWPAVKGRLEARLKRATPDERSRT